MHTPFATLPSGAVFQVRAMSLQEGTGVVLGYANRWVGPGLGLCINIVHCECSTFDAA